MTIDKNRMIQILADACEIEKSSLSADLRKLIMADEALTAMTRAVEEVRYEEAKNHTAQLETAKAKIQFELNRLRQCEAIVRELGKYDLGYYRLLDLRQQSRQWVRENPEPKPIHKPGCYIYMQGGECNCDLI